MISKRKLRIYYLIALMSGAALVVALVLYALRQNINLFYTPSELFAMTNIPHNQIRIGGVVQAGSVKYLENDPELKVQFIVTDFKQVIAVEYAGVLPDLFREGQGVIALGRYTNNLFMAQQVLAKHDEKYQPPELAAMKLQEP